jgi:hypothetical protein
MNSLVEEVLQWNSPCYGAYLLWQFTKGYRAAHPDGDAPVALMHFLAAPILTNRKLLEPISNHRENLQSYIRSFEDSKRSDILLGIQEMVKNKRQYTLAAIDIAIASGLIAWDIDSGKLFPNDTSFSLQKGNALKSTTIKNGKKAEILGKWFAEHNISTIATYLKVVL